MARSLEQRIADLERTVMEFFTGRSKKSSGRKAKKSAGRSAKKAKASRKTSKRKSAR